MSGISNMQSLLKQEKSKGVLLFAFDTETVKYTEIAIRCAALVRKNWNLPVTIVTGINEDIDHESLIRIDLESKNTRLDSNSGKVIAWKNFGRHLAYELSPYDETLLIDSDYLALDRRILDCFESSWDYLIGKRNINLGQAVCIDAMGPYSLSSSWATVVLFRKTEKSRQLFDLVGRIQGNYKYYRLLYNITASNYRNDHAFAIADMIINGYSMSGPQLHIPLTTIIDRVHSMKQVGQQLQVKYGTSAAVLPMQNLHVMDKQYLLSEDFRKFVYAQ